MNAAWLAWLVGLAIVGPAMGEAKACKVRVSELLDNQSTFDGHAVALQGTLTRLQVYVTRKGNRYYTFGLVQDRRNVLVVVHDRPSCKAGTVVRVQGRFDAAEKHVDATTVRCEQPSASDPANERPCRRPVAVNGRASPDSEHSAAIGGIPPPGDGRRYARPGDRRGPVAPSFLKLDRLETWVTVVTVKPRAG